MAGAQRPASALADARSVAHPAPLAPDPAAPPWITAQAAQAVADALTDAARQALPLAETRTQHLALENIRTSGRIARLVNQLTGEAGVQTATPYLDDRVVEICLATRPQERSSPWEFKPLLREALAETVPPECSGVPRRTTWPRTSTPACAAGDADSPRCATTRGSPGWD
ncbi:asparagine synthase-related protein [Streptomyces nogalater]